MQLTKSQERSCIFVSDLIVDGSERVTDSIHHPLTA